MDDGSKLLGKFRLFRAGQDGEEWCSETLIFGDQLRFYHNEIIALLSIADQSLLDTGTTDYACHVGFELYAVPQAGLDKIEPYDGKQKDCVPWLIVFGGCAMYCHLTVFAYLSYMMSLHGHPLYAGFHVLQNSQQESG